MNHSSCACPHAFAIIAFLSQLDGLHLHIPTDTVGSFPHNYITNQRSLSHGDHSPLIQNWKTVIESIVKSKEEEQRAPPFSSFLRFHHPPLYDFDQQQVGEGHAAQEQEVQTWQGHKSQA